MGRVLGQPVRDAGGRGRGAAGDGCSVILEIELQGARQVRKNRPDAVMVFVRAPSLEETRRRLEGRATETSEALEKRMATALKEIEARDEFDYEVVNGEREQAREDMIRHHAKDSRRRQRRCLTSLR